MQKRAADLTLNDDGSLEGNIEESLYGHSAARLRDDLIGEAEARQHEIVKERILATFSTAELTAIRIQNTDSSEKPLVVNYTIKIPGYASRTGKRLLFSPLFFQRGDAPKFKASERRFNVHFPNAWKEADEVKIKLPEGFTLDNAENPGGLEFGETGYYKLAMKTNSNGQLICEREFVLGRNGIIAFPQTAYPQLKALFDEIHSRDNTMISIKQDTGLRGGL